MTKYSVAMGLIVRSGGSRPLDKGGGGHPDPEIMGDDLKNFFSTFQASVWSKNQI